ncbi:MAG: 3-phosphoserine/phosphohydroxythreonine transaminase, partial [Candidatus Omnitrophota bacterium]
HRGKVYMEVHAEAIANVKQLLQLPDDYAVLFLQGGATAQFAMIPMNLLPEGKTADYVNTGEWATKAIKEAKTWGQVNVAADTSALRPCRMPNPDEMKWSADPVYVHITSNETISGTQWKTYPKAPSLLVADMSSDILSRPIDVKSFALIYAGAQKNLGPAGVCLVVIRKEVAERTVPKVPLMFCYNTHLKNDSMYNTPPCFGIYVLGLVTRWLIQLGGVEAIGKRNEEKAKLLYDIIDGSGFYRPTADKAHRSPMNVTFRLPSEELEAQFLKEAQAKGMMGLAGHRSVGGLRASLYNACPPEAVKALTSFMKEFERKNG